MGVSVKDYAVVSDAVPMEVTCFQAGGLEDFAGSVVDEVCFLFGTNPCWGHRVEFSPSPSPIPLPV